MIFGNSEFPTISKNRIPPPPSQYRLVVCDKLRTQGNYGDKSTTSHNATTAIKFFQNNRCNLNTRKKHRWHIFDLSWIIIIFSCVCFNTSLHFDYLIVERILVRTSSLDQDFKIKTLDVKMKFLILLFVAVVWYDLGTQAKLRLGPHKLVQHCISILHATPNNGRIILWGTKSVLKRLFERISLNYNTNWHNLDSQGPLTRAPFWKRPGLKSIQALWHCLFCLIYLYSLIYLLHKKLCANANHFAN